MLWALLATAIMAYSGDGDDRSQFRKLTEVLQQAIKTRVQEPARRAQALESINGFTTLFNTHRAGIDAYSKCVGGHDRTFGATLEDYEKCKEGNEEIWSNTEASYIKLHSLQAGAITAEEGEKISKDIAKGMK